MATRNLELKSFVHSAEPASLRIFNGDAGWYAQSGNVRLSRPDGSIYFADLTHLLAVLASVGIRACAIEWDGLDPMSDDGSQPRLAEPGVLGKADWIGATQVATNELIPTEPKKPLRREGRTPEIDAAFAQMHAERAARAAARPIVEAEGRAALGRLWKVANGHSGQCRHVASFLVGLYHGGRFRFDLTDLRCVDGPIFDDCIAVLMMDAQPKQEVHTYFENGGQKFEELAQRWGIKDYLNSPFGV
jgi:hypothetical protein